MFDKLSDRCREVFRLAHKIARASGRSRIDTETLLLALSQQGEKTLAVQILREVGLLEELSRRVNVIGDLVGDFGTPLGLTDEAKLCIQDALQESQSLNFNFIATEHLLLGLLKNCDYLKQRCKELGLDKEDFKKMVSATTGINLNNTENYRRHRMAIQKYLEGDGSDEHVVSCIVRYLRLHLPC